MNLTLYLNITHPLKGFKLGWTMIPHDKKQTVVIGAGAAGLAAAIELCRAEKDFVIFEKTDRVGGLAKTHILMDSGLEFRTDNGPHISHRKNRYLHQFVDKNSLVQIKLRERVFFKGKYFDFPVRPWQLCMKLGFFTITKVLFDYCISVINYRILKKPINNFYDYSLANLGKSFAVFTTNFMEKVYGLPAKELHIDLAKQRFKFLSATAVFKTILKRLLRRKGKSKGYLLFPEPGTGFFYEAQRNEIENAGYSIFFNSFPTKIIHEENHIRSVKMEINQKAFEVNTDYLIESIHIPDVISLFEPQPPPYVTEAAARLRYRSQVYLFITLNVERVIEDHSIYFVDSEIPFSRVSEMKNFSMAMSPPQKSSLLIEFFCNEGDIIHSLKEEELLESTLPFLEKYISLKRSHIRSYYRFQSNKSYPVYDLAYEMNLMVVKGYLDSFHNLFYIGRPGRFEYTSQLQSIEMGIRAAHAII
jgi:protoporphyrinogen oxidase